MSHSQPVGIDLGTTNSAVGYFDARGRTVLLRNASGELLTPSAVLFDDDEIVVGREAVKAARSLPDRVAFASKRDMGRSHYARDIRGRSLPPEAIAATILRQLRADTVAVLGEAPPAVITVPAYFDEVRRRATRAAAELAGWNVIDMVNEPTAAALAWCEQLGYFDRPHMISESRKLLVYDLGGGTFDATLIEHSAAEIRTIATDGDFCLGGLDFDERLVHHAAEQFIGTHGSDPRDDAAAFARLTAEAEQAKQALSSRTTATMQVDHLGHSLAVPVTREEFEQLTEDLLERTAFTTRQTLAAGGCTWSDLSEILLVGGSSRMPMVARCLEQLSGLQPSLSATCDEDVSRGAALFARFRLGQQLPPSPDESTLQSPPEQSPWTPPSLPASSSPASSVWTPPTVPNTNTEDTTPANAAPQIIDVNSHSLGIQGIDRETLQRENVILIPRNTPLPAAKSNLFTTRTADQRTIVIQVLEGENASPDLCAKVARAVIRDLPHELPEGTPIEVTYRYDRNGLLTVEAHLPGSGRRVEIEVERDTGLSQDGFSQWRAVLALGPHGAGWDCWQTLAEEAPLVESDEDDTESPEPDSEDEEPHDFSGLAADSGSGSLGEGYREQQELRRQESRRRLVTNLVGHVVASTLGLVLGYIILCWLSPQADFLHLFHK